MNARITCRVMPNAKKTAVGEFEVHPELGEVLRVRLQAPPTDGRANKELVAVLAKHFGVRKSEVVIVRGEKSRVKVVDVGEPRREEGAS